MQAQFYKYLPEEEKKFAISTAACPPGYLSPAQRRVGVSREMRGEKGAFCGDSSLYTSHWATYYHSSGCNSLKRIPVMQTLGLWRTLDALERFDTDVIHSGPHLMAACLLFSLLKNKAQSGGDSSAHIKGCFLRQLHIDSVYGWTFKTIPTPRVFWKVSLYFVDMVLNMRGPGAANNKPSAHWAKLLTKLSFRDNIQC